MNKSAIMAMGALVLASGVAMTPAKAAVAVRIGVAAPVEECVRYKARHHGRVIVARYSYCNEPVWTGGPVVISGVTYRENLHYRMRSGHRYFWIGGRWHRHD